MIEPFRLQTQLIVPQGLILKLARKCRGTDFRRVTQAGAAGLVTLGHESIRTDILRKFVAQAESGGKIVEGPAAIRGRVFHIDEAGKKFRTRRPGVLRCKWKTTAWPKAGSP